MNTITNRLINKELKGIAQDFEREYNIRMNASENAYRQSLKPGQQFIPHKGFYDERNRDEFRKVCDSAKEKAHGVINRLASDILDATTKAPSTEAVNAISLLASRKNVSADEIDMFMTKFGLDCPLAYKSLKEIAEAHGYHDFKDHPLAEQAEGIQTVVNSIERTFNPFNAEQNGVVASTAGFCANVDQAFPTE